MDLRLKPEFAEMVVGDISIVLSGYEVYARFDPSRGVVVAKSGWSWGHNSFKTRRRANADNWREVAHRAIVAAGHVSPWEEAEQV